MFQYSKYIAPFPICYAVFVGNYIRMSFSFRDHKVGVQYLLLCLKIDLFCRFPQLFPPLKPEVVAQRTVEAVRADKAFLYLPWTMHALVILKRYKI